MKAIPFTIAAKIKYTGINLTDEEKYVYNENYKTLMVGTEETLESVKISNVYGLEEAILLKCSH